MFNSDLFDHEISDGLNCLAFGKVPNIESPVVIAGGNCSIVGLDVDGEEQFWTVTGDNARAIEFIDWDEDGEAELVVGSDDFAIRVFKGEELIYDINEAAAIKLLKRLRRALFGFALENGLYGVYYGRKRLWKQRQQAKVTALVGMDFETGDNQLQLVVGFEDGLIEVRKHRSGDLLHSVHLPGEIHAPIANLFYYDFRMSGSKQLIGVDAEGRVAGYSVSKDLTRLEEAINSQEKVVSDDILKMGKEKIDLKNKLGEMEQRKQDEKELS